MKKHSFIIGILCILAVIEVMSLFSIVPLVLRVFLTITRVSQVFIIGVLIYLFLRDREQTEKLDDANRKISELTQRVRENEKEYYRINK